METGLTPHDVAALAGIMFLGALVPGVSVLAVSARAAALGFSHGLLTAAGIVVGDMVFILIAIYGLSVLADLLGSYFVLLKYAGGVYLIWLGSVLWRSKSKTDSIRVTGGNTMPSSFLAGLLITLADQKAVLFYLGIFPAFADLTALSVTDTGIILIIAMVAVGGPKLWYAFMADKAGLILKNARATSLMNQVAGGMMMGVGVFILAKA